MTLSFRKLYLSFFKDAFDRICAAIGLFFLFPLFLIIALAVKIDSPGSILFSHERVGLHGRTFRLYKFRSMRQDTGQRGSSVTMKGDSRITNVGKFIRKYKLDELPQLINVVRGDISLVGPRPEVKKYVDLFNNDYQYILTVKPGITDYAALEFRNEEEILTQYAENIEHGYTTDVLPKKIELYKNYIKSISFLGDLRIIFKTLWGIF